MDLSAFDTTTIAGAVIITGLVVVFIALVGLWAIVALFGKFFAAQQKPKMPTPPSGKPTPPQASAPPTPTLKPAMQVENGIGDEVVAVIAAAVAAMSGGTAAIRSVKRAKEARSSWAQAGVLQNTQPF